MNQIIVRTGHAADPIYNYRFVESHAIPVAVRVRVIIGRKPISIENFIQPPLRRKSMRSDRPSGRRNIAAGHKELQFGNAPVRTVGRIQSPVAIFFRGPNGNHIGKNNAVDTIQNLCNPEVGIVGGFDPGTDNTMFHACDMFVQQHLTGYTDTLSACGIGIPAADASAGINRKRMGDRNQPAPIMAENQIGVSAAHFRKHPFPLVATTDINRIPTVVVKCGYIKVIIRKVGSEQGDIRIGGRHIPVGHILFERRKSV